MSDVSPAVQREVIDLVRAFEGRFPQELWCSTLELAKVGEEGIALENLVSNAFEHDAAVTSSEKTEILRLAKLMGITPDRLALP